MKRQKGRLKSGYQGGLSRQKFKCHVPSCGSELRSDKLREHFKSLVLWDDEGGPIAPDTSTFKIAKQKKQAHTKYFFDNGYSKVNMPAFQVPSNLPSFSFSYSKRPKTNSPEREEFDFEQFPEPSIEAEPIVTSAIAEEIVSETLSKMVETISDDNAHIHFEERFPLIESSSTCVSESSNAIVKEQGVIDLSEDSIRKIVDGIGSILLEKNAKKTKTETTSFKVLLSKLVDNGDEYICMPCIKHSHSKNVPAKLKKMSVGHFGIFKKLDSSRLINKERRNNIKSHFDNPLHNWCSNFTNELERCNDEFEKKNKIAGRKIITNVIYCLKHSMSSKDFVRLNNKDELVADSQSSSCATKNDGAQQFFYYRDLIYDILRKYIKLVFQNVKSASFTLDKVTVCRIPYTVLVTFFFHEGKIRGVMNNLHNMRSNEYDGVNTANLVGIDLMASLGLSRREVGEKFHHSVYDGVYATPEERVAGGGCLSLNRHFESWCSVENGSMTGHWDMGHKLQLVYGDALLSNNLVKRINKIIFGVMGQYTCGQASLHFKELSIELSYPTLANKKFQETRWVRASLAAYQAFYRNLPTFYILLGRVAADCQDEEELFDVQTSLEEITNPTFLAIGIALCQLLEIYSKVSLDSQYMCSFPSTVLSSVYELCESLEKLGKAWEWEPHELQFIDIGSPKDLVRNLKAGHYEPHVSDNVKKRAAAARKVNMNAVDALKEELSHDWGSVCDIFKSVELSTGIESVSVGQIPILAFDDNEDEEVKENMQCICKDLYKSLQERLKPLDITKATLEAFSEYRSWYDQSMFNSEEQVQKLRRKIELIIMHIKGPFAKTFSGHENIENIVTGYNIFLRYASNYKNPSASSQDNESEPKLEEIYEKFWSLHKTTRETELFIDFFQFVQSKSFSEAICESIGSIMNMATSSGRILDPSNFAKEIFLRFNLPPLHIISNTILPDILSHELYDQKKEFIRKADTDPRQLRKLKFKETSSTIGNFRLKEERSFLGVSDN